METTRLINGPSACALLGVGERALVSLVEMGRLTPQTKPGGVRRMYDVAEIAALDAVFRSVEGEQETTREQIVRGWTIQHRRDREAAESAEVIRDIADAPLPPYADAPLPPYLDPAADLRAKLDALRDVVIATNALQRALVTLLTKLTGEPEPTTHAVS